MNMELTSRDRSRILAVAILLAVFAAGLFGGAAFTVATRGGPRVIHHEERVVRGPGDMMLGMPGDHRGMVFMRTPEPLDARLGLNEEQRARVERLMQEQRQKAERLMSDMEPRMKALMDSTNAAIEAVLTPEQREQFRELQKERRDMIIRRFNVPAPEPGPAREAPPE